MLIIGLIAALMIASILSKLFGEDAAGYIMFLALLFIYLGALWACDRFFGTHFLGKRELPGFLAVTEPDAGGSYGSHRQGYTCSIHVFNRPRRRPIKHRSFAQLMLDERGNKFGRRDVVMHVDDTQRSAA
jgi:hypothetical protein